MMILKNRNFENAAFLKIGVENALNEALEGVFNIDMAEENEADFQENPQNYLKFIVEKFNPIRDEIIYIFSHIALKDYFVNVFADFVEKYKETNMEKEKMIEEESVANNYLQQARSASLHEIILYVVTMMWRNEQYSKINDIYSHVYLVDNGNFIEECILSQLIFYKISTNLIDVAKNDVDGENYPSGLAKHWTEHLIGGYSLDNFVFADTLMYNLCVLEGAKKTYKWHPILYPQSLRNPIFHKFATKLKYECHLHQFSELFGGHTLEVLKKKFYTMKEDGFDKGWKFRVGAYCPPLITDVVKPDEIGAIT